MSSLRSCRISSLAIWSLSFGSCFQLQCDSSRVDAHRVMPALEIAGTENSSRFTGETEMISHFRCLGGVRRNWICPLIRAGAKAGTYGDLELQLRSSKTGERGDYEPGDPLYTISLRKLALKIASTIAGASSYEVTKFSNADGMSAPGTGFCMFMHQLLLATAAASYVSGGIQEVLQYWGADFDGVTKFVESNVGATVGDVMSWLEPFICLNFNSAVRPGAMCMVISPGFGVTGALMPTSWKVGIEKPHILSCSKATTVEEFIETSSSDPSLFQEPADITFSAEFVQNGRIWSSSDVSASLNYMRMAQNPLTTVNNVVKCPMQAYQYFGGRRYPCQTCEDTKLAFEDCPADKIVPTKAPFDGIEQNCNICPKVVKTLANAYYRLSRKDNADQVWLGEHTNEEEKRKCNVAQSNCSQDDDSVMCAWKENRKVDPGECSDLCGDFSGNATAKCKDIAHRLVGRYRMEQSDNSVFWTPRQQDLCWRTHERREDIGHDIHKCQLYKIVHHRFLLLHSAHEGNADLAATQVCAELGSTRQGYNYRWYPCFLRKGETA